MIHTMKTLKLNNITFDLSTVANSTHSIHILNNAISRMIAFDNAPMTHNDDSSLTYDIASNEIVDCDFNLFLTRLRAIINVICMFTNDTTSRLVTIDLDYLHENQNINSNFDDFIDLIFESKMQKEDVKFEILNYVQALETNYNETI